MFSWYRAAPPQPKERKSSLAFPKTPTSTSASANKERLNPKYCHGRMDLVSFALLHFFILTNSLVVILVPLAYFVFIPAFLQSMLDGSGNSNSKAPTTQPTIISKLSLGSYTPQSFSLATSLALTPLNSLPLKVGFANLNVRVSSLGKYGEVAGVSVSDTELWVNTANAITPSLTFSISPTQQGGMTSLLTDYSLSLLQNSTTPIRMDFCPTLKVYGVTLYQSLCLHYTTSLSNLQPLLTPPAPSGPAAQPSSFLFQAPNANDQGSALRSNFAHGQISSLSEDFPFVWRKFGLVSDDTYGGVEFGVAFENPTVFGLDPLSELSFYLEVEGSRIVKVSLDHLSLNSSVNPDFDTVLKLTFLNDTNLASISEVQAALERASTSYANTQDFGFAICGPLTTGGVEVVGVVTKDFRIGGRFANLFNSTSSSTSTPAPSSTSSSGGLQSMLGNSSIALEVLSTGFQAILGLQLPSMTNLKAPEVANVPYGLGFNLYGGNGSLLMNTLISPPIFGNLSGVLVVNTTVAVIPVNTGEAATALAGVVNPIIAVIPQASSIGLKDFSLLKSDNTTFKWCTEVFGTRILNFSIPVQSSSSATTSTTSSTTGTDLSKYIEGVINVAQLTSQPGFGANGTVNITYPSGLPQLHIDVGYFTLDTMVEEVNFMNVALPSGLAFFPSASGTVIDAQAVLDRNPQISSKLQEFANAYMNPDVKSPSALAVTGIKFGVSQSQNFITFSEIVYEVSASSMGSSSSASSSTSSSLPAGMLKVQSVDLKVNSATDVTLSTTAQINNPYPVAFSLGTLNLQTLLNSHDLVGVSLAPISIGAGASAGPTTFALDFTMATDGGSGQLATNVGTLAGLVMNGGVAPASLMAGLTGIKLTPAGGNANAVIDQLTPVTVSVPASKFAKSSTPASIAPGPIDFTAVTGAGSISVVNVQAAKLATLPQATVSANGAFNYKNPMPVTASVPYFAIGASLNSQVLASFQASGISLAPGSGSMSPSANIVFKNTPGLPDQFAAVVASAQAGTAISGTVNANGFFFGTSASNQNGIFSKVSYDVTSMVASSFSKASTAVSKRSLAAGTGPYGITYAVNGAQLAVKPQSTLGFGTIVAFNSSFNLDVNVGYLGANGYLDNLLAGSLSLALNTNSSGVAVAGQLAINDVPDLATRIGVISKSLVSQAVSKALPVQGNAIPAEIVFGVSAQDSVLLFSKVKLAGVPLSSLVSSQSSSSSSTASSSTSGLFNFTNMGVVALPAKTLQLSSTIALQNSYPVSVSGLGYLAANAGLDDVTIVQISAPGFAVSQGLNNFSLAINALFPSSSTIQSKVAAFGKDLQTNLGSTTENLFGSGFALGVSSTDYIKAFSQVQIVVPSNSMFKASSASSASTSSSSSSSMFNLQNVLIAFQADKSIRADVSTNLTLPYQVSLDLPYLALGGDLNANHLFDVEMSNIKATPGATNNLDINSLLHFQDTDPLATDIATIVQAYNNNATLPGYVAGGYLLIGSDNSSANVIDTFAKFAYPIPLRNLTSTSTTSAAASATPSSSVTSGSFSYALNQFSVSTLPGRIVGANVSASINSTYAIAIQGLGLIQGSAGVDNTPVCSININGLEIAAGSNNLNLGTSVAFSAGPQVAASVAGLYNAVMNNGPAHIAVGSGLLFGYDQANAFHLLSKAVFGVPSSKLISANSTSTTASTSNTNMMANFFASKFHLNTHPDSTFLVDFVGGLTNTTFQSKGQIGYLQFETKIDSDSLVHVSVPSGIQVESVNSQVGLTLSTLLSFGNSAGVQSSVGDISTAYFNNLTDSLAHNVAGTGLMLGSDSNLANIIDAFSQISISQPVSKLLAKSNSTGAATTASPSSSAFTIPTYNTTYSDMDVFDNQTLVFNFGMDVHVKEGMDLAVNLPYLSGLLKFNDRELFTVSVLNTALNNGLANTTLLLKSMGYKDGLSHLVRQWGHIVETPVSTYIPSSDFGSALGLSFGYNSFTNVQTLSAVNMNKTLNDLAEANKFVPKPNAPNPDPTPDTQGLFYDIHCVLNPDGVRGDITLGEPYSWPFFHTLAEIDFKSSFQSNRSGPMYGLAVYHVVSITLPTMVGLVKPDMTPFNGSVEAAYGLSAFTGDHYNNPAGDSCFGYFTFTGSNPANVFTDLDSGCLYGSAGYPWAPYVFNVNAIWPWNSNEPFDLSLPLEISVSFPNYGALHVDFGEVEILLKSSLNNATLLQASTAGNLVIGNDLEKGAPQNVSNYKEYLPFGTLQAHLPLGDFSPFNIVNTIETLWGGNTTIDFGFYRNGTKMTIVNDVLSVMPNFHPVGVPTAPQTLAAVIASSIFEIGGGVLNNNPIFQEIEGFLLNMTAPATAPAANSSVVPVVNIASGVIQTSQMVILNNKSK